MAETATLKLPLVAASQAQKHVTVNEALARIDAALQLSVGSRTLTTPPSLPVEGDAYLVPDAGAVNAWDGEGGKIAFFLNGGWDFLTPLAGWRVFVADQAVHLTHDGTDWLENVLSMSGSGAAMRAETIEVDFDLTPGASALTGFIIPFGSVVYGVTGLVTQAITGTLTDWSLGVEVSADRYGTSYGIGQGSWVRGLTGQPQAYYENTQLKLSASGGDFAGGTVRLAVHLMRFDVPRP